MREADRVVDRASHADVTKASFEILLKDLAVDFLHVPAMEVDDEVERWLRRIVEYFDADRSSISEITPTGIAVTHSWARPGHQLTLGTSERSLPWLAAKLIGLVVYIGLGAVAIRRRNGWAMLAAVLVFLYIAGAAMRHSPLSWFAG